MNEIFKLIAESGRTDLMEEWYKIEKKLEVLEIIKERFVWLNNGELYCGRRFDIEIPIDEDIEDNEEIELLKKEIKDE